MSADRYISQNELITEIAKIHGNLNTRNVGQAIWDTPTADVVEVVRCDKCKHLNIINSREVYARCRMTDLEFKPFDIDTRKQYCSYRERREV